ncbi:universal stress protein [Sinobaca qinghaiensis]|nr:universal stress protein [Sinobaca qinghaiensis]
MKQYQRILVGVEALEGVTHNAFEEACSIAKANDAALIIAFVMDKNGYAMLERTDPRGFAQLKNEAVTKLKEYEEEAVKQGITDVQAVLEVGAPAKMLVQDLCQKHKTDLIIIGQTGGTKIDQLLLGNKSKKIQKKSACEVKVVSGNTTSTVHV